MSVRSTRETTPLILHIVLPVPVRHHFDYLSTGVSSTDQLQPGTRWLVPFGKQKQLVGILVGTSTSSSLATGKLKKIIRPLDDAPLFNRDHFRLLSWAGNYYHYPLGELIFSTLPTPLKLGKKASLELPCLWQLSERFVETEARDVIRGKKQKAILEYIESNGNKASDEELDTRFHPWRGSMKTLSEKGLVLRVPADLPLKVEPDTTTAVKFSSEQHRVFDLVRTGIASDQRFLLDGITGSGKTEIYIEAIRHVIRQGKQAMILVPEIGLTPHFVSHFRDRLQTQLVVLHSGLTERQRLQGWMQARDGIAPVVLGTRSAVWTPMKNPGIFIVDEEHDPSYKQQEGLRYSARDIAVLRASNDKAPLILGSATPSLESLRNVQLGKLTRITLIERAKDAVLPEYRIVDLRRQKMTGALSDTMIETIRNVLKKKQQVLLFLNRRGYSPILLCDKCGWIATCRRCNIPTTFHKYSNILICHHCGTRYPPPDWCPECADTGLVRIGHGTERLTETLEQLFPSARILRIDRDSTRSRGSIETLVDTIKTGSADIMVGTQMLAKGHHFPNVTLVGIIDADRGLYSSDFRASERMAQLIVQVSGRAGREKDPGLVLIQTHFPQHPLINTLINHDYNTFARLLLEERRESDLPPFSYMAILRAEAYDAKLPAIFLEEAQILLHRYQSGLMIFGPFPAPIEKRSGRYRFQLVLQSNQRSAIQNALPPWIRDIELLRNSKKIRWSLDVDPQEML